MRLRPCLLLLVCFGGMAGADPASVYESIDDVSIGPLFLTPAERRWLDARRNAPVVPQPKAEAEVELGPTQEPAEPKVSPAGFIIRSDGAGQRWSNGDFVSSQDAAVSTMKFPGEVDLIRHDDGDKARRTEGPKNAEPVAH